MEAKLTYAVEKTEFIQHEVPLREATAPLSLLVGSEAEALWSVCLN